MIKRRVRGPKTWAVVFFAAIVIPAGVLLSLQALASDGSSGEQPILFPHNLHVQSVKLDCEFCHRLATTRVEAGVPAVQQCMFCHQVAGQQSPEVQKLLTANSEGLPINWKRVYWVPDHVRFTHAPHVQAGVTCGECHPGVETMTLVAQARTLKMGDCVGCHRQQNAPTDCYTCHY